MSRPTSRAARRSARRGPPYKADHTKLHATLRACDVIAFVATTDFSRAKAFYADTLGLALLSADKFALVFDAHGTMLRVTTVQEVAASEYTVLGWRVPNVVRVIDDLRRAGIKFEKYAGMNQDERGIWKAPGGAQVAWFKDPDGNTLSLTQF